MSLATVGAIVGIGAGIYGMTQGGGGGGGGGGSPYYMPTGSGQADQTWQSMLQQMSGAATGQAGQLQPDLSGAYNAAKAIDPSGYLSAANQAGGYYGQLAGRQDQFGNDLAAAAGVNRGAQGQLMGAGNQLWQTSLDPQNALRAQLQQQVTDASRAGTSARGIGMSGNAAGIENQDVSNFLMNWQNQQLGRQAQGLQGMTGAYNQAGQQGDAASRNLVGSAAMGQGAAQSLQSMGQVPYQAQQNAAQWPFNAANMYSGSMQQGVYSPMSGTMSGIVPYLNFGVGAGQNAFNQQQTGLNNFTTGLGQLGQMFNNPQGGPNMYSLYNNNGAGNQGSNWSGSADPYGGASYGP